METAHQRCVGVDHLPSPTESSGFDTVVRKSMVDLDETDGPVDLAIFRAQASCPMSPNGPRDAHNGPHAHHHRTKEPNIALQRRRGCLILTHALRPPQTECLTHHTVARRPAQRRHGPPMGDRLGSGGYKLTEDDGKSPPWVDHKTMGHA